jgi:Spy/CpxP family protein refolding chaperone
MAMSLIGRLMVNRMGRYVRVALMVLFAAALSVTPMVAQDNSGTPLPGGPGHRGGPGGPGGPRGMMGPPLGMLTKQLDLTPDQVTQIKAIYADAGTQMKALHDDTSLAQADKRQKMFAIHQDSQSKFMGLLTADQKTKFEAMQEKMKEHRGQYGRGPGGPPPPPPAQ